MNQEPFSEAISKISNHLKSADIPLAEGLTYACTVLRKTFDHYDWVGFYFADFDISSSGNSWWDFSRNKPNQFELCIQSFNFLCFFIYNFN